MFLRELAAITLFLSVAMIAAAAWESRDTAPPSVALVPRHVVRVATIKQLVARPRSTPARARVIARAVSRTALPPGAVAAAPLPPQQAAPDPAQLAEEAGRVAARISQKVPAALVPYFDAFVYVSKSSNRPWGQRLFLFHKRGDGTLDFEESFAVSTGREKSEQYFTATPTGLFELDVHRFFPMARSAKWDEARMPWAMFLNYSYRNKMSGVALHAAIGGHELAMMGRRASGGCVRLPLAKASLLYHRFLRDEHGPVPVFTFDEARGTTNTTGIAAHDAHGDILLVDGLRVLVVIDNYAGTRAEATQS